MCEITHQQHQHHHTHITNIARFISREFGVIGARSLISRYGIEAVQEVAIDLHEAALRNGLEGLKNPGGFFVWKVRQLVEAQQQPHLRDVSRDRRKQQQGGEQ